MTRVLAIDVGTTALKAVVLDGDTVVAEAEAAYPLHLPAPGWAEQDPDDWWSACRRAVADLGGAGAAVDVIALTGQMQDLVPLDAQGRPTHRAILYSDTRAGGEHDECLLDPALIGWAQAIGAEPDATMLPAKWRWFTRHRPEAAARTVVVLFGAHAAVAHRLTGIAACDPTTAATTGLFAVDHRSWWRPVVDAVAIAVPAVVEATTVLGPLAAGPAADLGLPAGVPVVLGPGDAVATTLGVVGTDAGVPYAYAGTSGWVGVTTTQALRRPGLIALPGIALPGAAPGWLSVAPMPTAGAAVDWARATLLGGIDSETCAALVRSLDHPAAAEGVLFLPHLDGTRAPVPATDATGVLLGVGRSTSTAVVAAAVYEGVAHALRAIAGAVAPDADSLAVCGGGARADAWCQVLADVTGVVVHAVADEHAAVRGAASCARIARGAEPLAPAPGRATFVPRPDHHAAHAAVAAVHDQLPGALAATFGALAPVRRGFTRPEGENHQ